MIGDGYPSRVNINITRALVSLDAISSVSTGALTDRDVCECNKFSRII